MQILHKLEPTRPVRYPVDVAWFNDRCDMINKLSAELVRGNEHRWAVVYIGNIRVCLSSSS